MTARRIAYLGPPGTFGELAVRQWAPAAEHVAFPSHAAVAFAVADGSADEGLLPVENSVEGSVNESLDLLIHEVDLKLCGEVVAPIEQCLVVWPGTALDAVRVIYSHPQALGQCRRYLERTFPGVRLEATLSTAGAVRDVMERADAAAIASRRAAEVHGAAIAAAAIQDRANNVTRFVVVAKEDAAPTGRDKTSIAFTTHHDRPGSLVAILNEFAFRAINLTKIESRPSKDALGVYVFLIDFEGHRADPLCAEALAGVATRAHWLKVFGSYPQRPAASDEGEGER